MGQELERSARATQIARFGAAHATKATTGDDYNGGDVRARRGPVRQPFFEMFPGPPSEIDRWVETRLLRQQVLTRDPPLQLQAVVDESVMRRGFGGETVMRQQLEHLSASSELPNVEVRIYVTAMRVASPKTVGTPRAECQFGAISTITQRTGAAAQDGGNARRGCPGRIADRDRLAGSTAPDRHRVILRPRLDSWFWPGRRAVWDLCGAAAGFAQPKHWSGRFSASRNGLALMSGTLPCRLKSGKRHRRKAWCCVYATGRAGETIVA
jgi:hypothetical protein